MVVGGACVAWSWQYRPCAVLLVGGACRCTGSACNVTAALFLLVAEHVVLVL